MLLVSMGGHTRLGKCPPLLGRVSRAARRAPRSCPPLVDRAEAFLALNGRWHGRSMSKPCSLRSIVQWRSPPLNFPDALNLTREQLGKHGALILPVYSCDSFQTILTCMKFADCLNIHGITAVHYFNCLVEPRLRINLGRSDHPLNAPHTLLQDPRLASL